MCQPFTINVADADLRGVMMPLPVTALGTNFAIRISLERRTGMRRWRLRKRHPSRNLAKELQRLDGRLYDTQRAGSWTVNVEPFPRPSLATLTSPPCSRTICFTSANPRPKPDC